MVTEGYILPVVSYVYGIQNRLDDSLLRCAPCFGLGPCPCIEKTTREI